MAIITLKHGTKVIIDDKDIELVTKYNWCPTGNKYIHNRKLGLLHRFLMNPKPKEFVDHINNNRLDNRRSNLRICTKSQNSMNMKKCSKKTASQYKGVILIQSKHWHSRIKLNGKTIHIGTFSNEKDAAKAYNKKARELFGEFALPNFPL